MSPSPPARPAAPPLWRRAVRRARREIAVPLLDFLLPTVCFGCGHRLGLHQQLGACASCWAALALIAEPLCSGCGLPRPPCTDLVGPAAARCARCLLAPLAVERVRPAVIYDAAARTFLLRAKLGRRPELLEILGRQLARVLQAEGFAGGDALVVPVPAHPWTRCRRGFNPALELARPIARELDLRLGPGILRRRILAGRALKRQGAARRRELAASAFRLAAGVQNRRVLLVDDVMTTGATVEACARVLRRGGALEVRAAVWARTLPRDPG